MNDKLDFPFIQKLGLGIFHFYRRDKNFRINIEENRQKQTT